MMAINVNGVFYFCRAVLAHMKEQKYGRIVNIASLSTFVGFYQVAAYTASKGAVAAFTRVLAIELAHQGVIVNAIAPGLFPTELTAPIIMGTPRGEELLMRTPMGRWPRAAPVRMR